MNELSSRAKTIAALLAGSRQSGSHDSALGAALNLIDALIGAGEGAEAFALLEAVSTDGLSRTTCLELDIKKLEALCSLGRFREALHAWDRFVAEESTADLPRRLMLRAQILASHCLRSLNLLDRAEAELTAVRGELLLQPDGELLGLCALNLGNVAWARGDLARAKLLYEDAQVSARRSGSSQLEAMALRNLALVARSRARWKEADELIRTSLQGWRKIGNRNEEFFAIRSLSIVALKQGRFNDARAHAGEALRVATALQSQVAEQHALLVLGLVDLCAGDWSQSRSQLSRVSSAAESSPTSRPALLAHEFLGDVELEKGHAAEALKHYDEVWPRALALAPQGDIVAELRRRRAEAFLLLERRGEAYTEAKTALEHCRQLGDRYEEAATYRVLALAAASLGKPSEARDWFGQGLAIFADIETPYEWGKLWMAYGDWLSPEDPAAARDAYSSAERLWSGMGAKAKLAEARARLMAVTARLGQSAEIELAAERPENFEEPASVPKRIVRPRNNLAHRSEWALEHFGIVTRSSLVLDLLEQTARLALRNIPILVLGESGVGKELVAHGIHKLSGRPGTFVPINCGGIPRELVESEMFGHTRGSFTGAQVDKPGLFEQANNGTVFLDEVAEMPAEAQTRLLRFLESGEVRRVGQTAHRIIDVRVVAATNRSREDLEAGDRFRHDLYYRLGNANITLPPLRQRGEDVGLLLEHFWQKACEVETDPPRLSPEAKAKMESYSWPGNVRQLKHVITRIVATAAPGAVLSADEVHLEGPRVAGSLAEAIEDQERQRITEALQAVHGSRTEAARLLGMARTTLLGKMKRYGMMP